MSVTSARISAQPVRDDKPGTQEKTRQRIELSARLCEISAGICEFCRREIEDVLRLCLYQKEKLKFQQERLTALCHKLSAQQGKLKREEAEMLAQLSD
jgi:hypothetical protein